MSRRGMDPPGNVNATGVRFGFSNQKKIAFIMPLAIIAFILGTFAPALYASMRVLRSDIDVYNIPTTLTKPAPVRPKELLTNKSQLPLTDISNELLEELIPQTKQLHLRSPLSNPIYYDKLLFNTDIREKLLSYPELREVLLSNTETRRLILRPSNRTHTAAGTLRNPELQNQCVEDNVRPMTATCNCLVDDLDGFAGDCCSRTFRRAHKMGNFLTKDIFLDRLEPKSAPGSSFSDFRWNVRAATDTFRFSQSEGDYRERSRGPRMRVSSTFLFYFLTHYSCPIRTESWS
jgi:hypothetical protein